MPEVKKEYKVTVTIEMNAEEEQNLYIWIMNARKVYHPGDPIITRLCNILEPGD